MSRMGTPSAAFAVSVWANTSPTTPGLKPNWLMCTDEVAAAMSSSIGGSKEVPWTKTSPVAALLTGNARARSARRTGCASRRSARALSGDAATAVLLTTVVDVREPQRDRAQDDEGSHEAPRRPGPPEEQEQDRAGDDRADADAEQAEPESATQLHVPALRRAGTWFTSPGQDEVSRGGPRRRAPSGRYRYGS